MDRQRTYSECGLGNRHRSRRLSLGRGARSFVVRTCNGGEDRSSTNGKAHDGGGACCLRVAEDFDKLCGGERRWTSGWAGAQLRALIKGEVGEKRTHLKEELRAGRCSVIRQPPLQLFPASGPKHCRCFEKIKDPVKGGLSHRVAATAASSLLSIDCRLLLLI